MSFPRIAAFSISLASLIFTPAFGASDILPEPKQQAWQSVHNGNNAEHIVQARSAIKRTPNDADWHEILALCLDQTLLFKKEALKEAATAYRLNPTSARIITTYAILLTEFKPGKTAAPLAMKAISLDPASGRAHAALAASYFGGADQEKARGEIETALRLSKNDWDVNLLAAQFYNSIVDDHAGACLDRLVKGFAKNPNGYAERADYRHHSNNAEGALTDLRKALQLDPTQFELRCELGYFLLEMQRYKEAIKEYDFVIAHEPEPLPNSYFRRARAYEMSGDFQHAIPDASAAIKLANSYANKPDGVYATPKALLAPKHYRWCWLKRMAWYEKAGQTANALASATQLIKADPSCDAALQLRQEILRKQGHYLEALSDLNALIQIDGGVQDWYTARGEVLKKLGKTEEAKADFAKAEHLEKYGQ